MYSTDAGQHSFTHSMFGLILPKHPSFWLAYFCSGSHNIVAYPGLHWINISPLYILHINTFVHTNQNKQTHILYIQVNKKWYVLDHRLIRQEKT